MYSWKAYHIKSHQRMGVSVSVGVWVVTAPAHNTEHPGTGWWPAAAGGEQLSVSALSILRHPGPGHSLQRKQVRRDPDGEASSNYSGGCILHILLSCPCTPRTICTLQMLSYVHSVGSYWAYEHAYITNFCLLFYRLPFCTHQLCIYFVHYFFVISVCFGCWVGQCLHCVNCSLSSSSFLKTVIMKMFKKGMSFVTILFLHAR